MNEMKLSNIMFYMHRMSLVIREATKKVIFLMAEAIESQLEPPFRHVNVFIL